jgi:hypothetical protein
MPPGIGERPVLAEAGKVNGEHALRRRINLDPPIDLS